MLGFERVRRPWVGSVSLVYMHPEVYPEVHPGIYASIASLGIPPWYTLLVYTTYTPGYTPPTGIQEGIHHLRHTGRHIHR